MRMPQLHWIAITVVLELNRVLHGLNAPRTRDYERSAALRFIEVHDLDTFELVRGDGI